MQDRVPLYPGRVKLTPVSGQSNIYDMERADQSTQEGTKLNKASLLKDATAALFGLTSDAVPDDVFAILGKYSQHWWKRRSKQTLPTPSTSTTKVYLSSSYSSGSRVIYYSDSAIVNADGSVSLVNEQSTTVRSSESTGFPNCIVLKGKYIRNAYSPSSTDIYFIPEDATFTQETSPNKAVVVMGYKVSAKTVFGEWGFVQSTDRNTYPDSGESGGYEYQYLGIPFENAATAPKIATGSYTGTGGVGPSNPCVLNLGFNAKLVVVYPNSWPERGSHGWTANGFIWIDPCVKDKIDYNSSSDYYKLLFSMTDGVFSYNLGGEQSNYSDTLGGAAASYQCNESGKTYYYIAIG